MSFLARLFAPELEMLRSRLVVAKERENYLLAQNAVLEAEKFDYARNLRIEADRNRTRETELINRILLLAKTAPVSIADDEASAVKTAIENDRSLTLTDEEIALLHKRALDYCRTKFRDDYTKAEFDEIFALMEKSPDEWLNDE